MKYATYATLLAALALSLLSGCASYQPGSSAELPFHKLYVEPVGNNSYAPQAQAAVSAKLRDIFIRDGRIQLVTAAEQADAVLSVTLSNYTCSGNTRRQQTLSAHGTSYWHLKQKCHSSTRRPAAITLPSVHSANAAMPTPVIPMPPLCRTAFRHSLILQPSTKPCLCWPAASHADRRQCTGQLVS